MSCEIDQLISFHEFLGLGSNIMNSGVWLQHSRLSCQPQPETSGQKQLPANVAGKAIEDSPSAWVSVAQFRDTEGLLPSGPDLTCGKAWESNGRWPTCLDPCYPHGKPDRNVELLASAWSSPGCCGQLESEPMDGQCLHFCVFLFHSAFKISLIKISN